MRSLRELSRSTAGRGPLDRPVRGRLLPPLANVARLAEEVGELAREVNHQFGPKPKKPDEPEGSVSMELADILFVVICLANSQKIDLDEAFAAMLAKVTARDAGRWTKKVR
ncbi:MAG TPA: nucleotide pyrophosphohydrolase [Gemmatimonadales bacterium]